MNRMQHGLERLIKIVDAEGDAMTPRDAREFLTKLGDHCVDRADTVRANNPKDFGDQPKAEPQGAPVVIVADKTKGTDKTEEAVDKYHPGIPKPGEKKDKTDEATDKRLRDQEAKNSEAIKRGLAHHKPQLNEGTVRNPPRVEVDEPTRPYNR